MAKPRVTAATTATTATTDRTAWRKRRRRSRIRAVIFVFVLGLAANTALFAGKYTVIHTDKEIFAVKADGFDFDHVYVDVRGWTEADHPSAPQITEALVERGYEQFRPVVEPEPVVLQPARPQVKTKKPERTGRRLDRIFKPDKQ